jgi:exodeoxyribonuclease VIII
MTTAEYRKAPGINFSTLKAALKSPLHYQAALATKREQTPTMLLGTLAHSVILEGVALATLAVQKPQDMSFATKEGKAWKAEQTLDILSHDDYNAVLGMAEAIDCHKDARRMLEDCRHREVAKFGTVHGLGCKALIDSHSDSILADLKTTQDASPGAFLRKVQDLDYDLQIALYRELVNPEIWCGWITVESSAPFAVACYTPSAQLIASGSEKLKRALSIVAKCRETNQWPGFPGINVLDVPKWREIELSTTNE